MPRADDLHAGWQSVGGPTGRDGQRRMAGQIERVDKSCERGLRRTYGLAVDLNDACRSIEIRGHRSSGQRRRNKEIIGFEQALNRPKKPGSRGDRLDVCGNVIFPARRNIGLKDRIGLVSVTIDHVAQAVRDRTGKARADPQTSSRRPPLPPRSQPQAL